MWVEVLWVTLRSQRPDQRRARELVNENAPTVLEGRTEVNPRVVAYRSQGHQSGPERSRADGAEGTFVGRPDQLRLGVGGSGVSARGFPVGFGVGRAVGLGARAEVPGRVSA